MLSQLIPVVLVGVVSLVCAGSLSAFTGPFDGKTFKGRIAWSADGNYNDEDDWAASPVALAIFAEFGMQQKLVHFDYNCILQKTDPEWERIHATSVLDAAERFGYQRSIFHDCRKDLDGAVNSITRAINASSADDPLYFILAGPMEVPYQGIQQSDPDKRKHVYCISHSRWNDGFNEDGLVVHNKRSVIPTGVTWIQIRDQNEFLSTSKYGRPAEPLEWAHWDWMKDSIDPRVRFLHARMQVTTRADCSDAGMAYFLMTGDERPEIAKLRALLDNHRIPQPTDPRTAIRLEAENFLELEGFSVEYKQSDRQISHRICVASAGARQGRIRTPFNEPYTAAAGRYDVEVRYLDGQGGRSRYELRINEVPKGVPWRAAADDKSWHSAPFYDVVLRNGDQLSVVMQADSNEAGKLDYVQLNYLGKESPDVDSPMARVPKGAQLDDPAALPGQVIVAGPRPGYLKYNGGGLVFLSGPDNPEDFLFRGTLNPDGTRSDGGQEEMINAMAAARVNAFHCLLFRMQRCNIKNEGDEQHCPFVDCDPAKPLNEKALDQWDGWVSLLEQKGIVVMLEFYNDATDVERMGWTLDASGNLHPDEQRFITGIVNRFKEHKNILWGLEESANKLPAARTPHFKKIAEVIARTDNHHHPIIQSFVVPNDPDKDFPEGGVMADAYIGDPHIRVVTWLHVVPHGKDYEQQHQEYLRYYKQDASNFIVMKNETFHHPRGGRDSRIYMWSSVMAGLHAFEAYHHADNPSGNELREDGWINTFMEQTDFHRMKPQDDLAAGAARWVLADAGQSYIVYSYQCDGPMGLKQMTAGTYDLLWCDTATGVLHRQDGVTVQAGENLWSKPESMSMEIAVYIKRR